MANSNPNNNHNNNQEPFWAFVNSFNPDHPNGAGASPGVDHAANHVTDIPWASADGAAAFGAPWGPYAGWGPWGHALGSGGPWARGGRGRHSHRHHQRHESGPRHESGTEDEHNDNYETEKSPETMRDAPEDVAHEHDHPPRGPPPPFPAGPLPHHPPPHHGHNQHGPGSGHRGRGRGRGCAWAHGGRGRGGHRARHETSPPPEYSGPFDFRPLMHAFARHPFAGSIREYLDQMNPRTAPDAPAETGSGSSEGFVPPVDIFNTETAYVLHVALPGCTKEDVGVHWDSEKSTVNVAGVLYRPGDETFVQGLVAGERKIGMFERSIKLPPPGVTDKEDIDGFNITAKMENGLLVVTIPKIEREWTEIRKVDIE
ncbi:HSP20 family protein [Microdochium nivale]|nr:HSP20 family protein [Microdochium nivale]